MAPMDKIALALSDPIRLQILDLLAAGRDDGCCSPANPDATQAQCSCDLLAVLDLAPSRLSYHIKELREAGLITQQRQGRWVYFSLDRATVTGYMQALHERYVIEKEPLRTACCSPRPLIQLDTAPLDIEE